VPRATVEDVDRAVQSALDGFPSWAEAIPAARSRALLKLADRIESCAEPLAELESRNVGKPLAVAKDDVEFAIDNLRFLRRRRALIGRPRCWRRNCGLKLLRT